MSIAVCSLAQILQSQTVDDPPKKMRLCFNNGCQDLVWTGDHYEGREPGQTALAARYWITEWNANGVKFNSKTAKAVDGVFPLEGSYSGQIAKQGGSLTSSSFDWRIGYDKTGTLPFTLTWGKEAGNKAEGVSAVTLQPIRRSTTHPEILMPPGAVEEFASFPGDIRAVLQPSNAITREQAKLPCNSMATVTDVEALEIGKYALRAAQFERGHCWAKRSADAGNLHATVVLGVCAFFGWGTPKDLKAAYDYFAPFMKNPTDAWGVYFAKQCYDKGEGTPQDLKLGAQAGAWMMLHDSGQAVYLAIGSDDAAHIREYERGLVLLNPPMKSHEICHYDGPRTSQGCHTVTEVDQDRLNTQLQQADQADLPE